MAGARMAAVGAAWRGTWARMGRTKHLASDVMQTPLNRCLSTLDITLLGIGHMVGAGIYVLTGTVAKDAAGPAIVLSFFLAGLASLLSALCYAEFGARVPKAGSAYVYTYVTIGEFWAFVIGWNIVLEHMIGAASVARAWSGYVDSLCNGAISNGTAELVGGLPSEFLADYPDFLAFAVTLVYCALLTMGVKGSSYFNSIFTVVNLFVITFIILAGLTYADVSNWSTGGGFAPYGTSGIVAGAATCFYAFVGFDSIATAGEEARDPAKSIPSATVVSMLVVTVGYVMVAATLTLMVPYYTLNPAAAIPDAFAAHNATWAKWVVSVGALSGMTTTLFGSLFTLPRCIYAMAADGLLFSWLARISDKTKVPTLTLLLCGFFSALIALVFDIEKLVEFMSIGTLMAYTIVSASVIILRYQPASRCNIKSPTHIATTPTPASPTPTPFTDDPTKDGDEGGELRRWCGWVSILTRGREDGKAVMWAVVVFTLSTTVFLIALQYSFPSLTQPYPVALAILLAIVALVGVVMSVVVIGAHKQNQLELSFRVPFVPVLPLVSIFFNVALLLHLNPMTWIRFIIWMAIGLLVYFFYGQYHSREGEPVSSYSTLLSDSTPASAGVGGAGVLGSVQQTLSSVTAKIASSAAAAAATADRHRKDNDQRPIVEEEEEEEEDEDEEEERRDKVKRRDL
ncbi:hypothetical protein Pcinc_021836 [Petrolisthes cinctipes]|uniref:Cationic amino acid transporter C-terminal domain-containing protein n=1 Tax=Petrolisthes cinctipes TaxID=88211 RepID=A0AAE1FF70_PETCI|nr:hypothetical protein Pcinc_021836 [Petrolisthes cinctipes]